MVKTKKISGVKIRKVPEHLPVPLTKEERLNFGEELAEAAQAVQRAEAAKKQAVKQHNYEIQMAETRRQRLSDIVASRTEYREVTVEEKWDLTSDKYTRTRTDTGEVIFERRLNDEEKQTELFDAVEVE